MYDFTDLFREAANALRRLDYFHEALRYYEPLQQVDNYADGTCLHEMASCYKAVGLKAEAEECYTMIIRDDPQDHEAHVRLAELRGSDSTEQRHMVAVQRRKSRRRTEAEKSKYSKKAAFSDSVRPTIQAFPRRRQQATKRSAIEDRPKQSVEEVHSMFLKRRQMSEYSRSIRGSDWMTVTESLLQNFQNNKVFYPFDRHHRFYGYSKEARALASRSKHEIDALMESSQSLYGSLLAG